MAEKLPIEIPPDAELVECTGADCTKKIYWIEVAYKHPEKRTAGKTHYKTPVNPDGTNHWGDCPNARQFRKRK